MSERRGSSLLLTLLVTASMLATALNLATLVVTGLRRATVSAAATSPFYQAESGLERALFRVRQLRISPQDLNMGSQCDTDLSCGTGVDCMPGCWLDVSTPTTSTSLTNPVVSFPLVRKDQSVQVELLDTDTAGASDPRNCSFDDAVGSLSAAACIESLRVYCRDLGGGVQGTLVFTVTKVGERSAGVDQWFSLGSEGAPATSQDVYDLSTTDFRCSGSSVAFDLNDPFDLQGSYVVKIRALYSDVAIPAIYARGGKNNTGAPLASHVQLTAVAASSNAVIRQQVRAIMPGRVPVQGLADYLIYSECGLEKRATGAATYDCPNP